MRSDLDANHDHLAVGQPLATIEREEPAAMPTPPAAVPPRTADASPVLEPTTGVSHLLGPTAGPGDGNVRAILAILGALCIHAIFVLLLLGYMRGSAADLKDFLLAFGGALSAADIGIINYYFGRRAGETT